MAHSDHRATPPATRSSSLMPLFSSVPVRAEGSLTGARNAHQISAPTRNTTTNWRRVNSFSSTKSSLPNRNKNRILSGVKIDICAANIRPRAARCRILPCPHLATIQMANSRARRSEQRSSERIIRCLNRQSGSRSSLSRRKVEIENLTKSLSEQTCEA